jgi:hypothetical protein
LVSSFGRHGDGPGEFKSPDFILVSGDTLFILDVRALNRFHADGTYIDRFTVDQPIGQNGRTHAHYLALTDRGLVAVFSAHYKRQNDGDVYRDTLPGILLRVPDGQVISTVLRIVSTDLRVIGNLRYSDPFGPHFNYALDSKQAYIAGRDGKTIFLVPMDGSPQRAFTLDAAPVAVANARRDQFYSAIQDALNKNRSAYPAGEPDRMLKELRRAPVVSSMATIGRIIVSDSGEILVERPDLSAGTPSTPGETVWNVLSSSGSVRGQVTLPSLFKPTSFRGNLLAGVAKDSLDVQTVALYSLSSRN